MTRSSPTAWIGREIERLERAALARSPYQVESVSDTEICIAGKRLILAASNNYLGLASDERVKHAAAEATRRWGAGSGASPLVSGYTELQRELEADLAAFKRCEDCVVFSSGYLANLGAITSLVSKGDAVFSDELNHASIIDACRLSGAGIRVFRHKDVSHLESLAASGGYERGLVVTDGIFSMDGDSADLEGIVDVASRYGLMTMVDDAHGTGVVGPEGRGSVAAAGLEGRIDIVMGTLSKALGSAGGFVCTTHEVASWIRNRARSFIFDTAPAPASLGAARAALGIAIEEEWRRERIAGLRREIQDALASAGIDLGYVGAAIIPLIVGDARAALEAARMLEKLGVFAPAIRPPSVPEGTSRIRVAIMATFDDSQRKRLLHALSEVARRFVAGDPAVEIRTASPAESVIP
jgi:8-amino-7-oxononanoate synthase